MRRAFTIICLLVLIAMILIPTRSPLSFGVLTVSAQFQKEPLYRFQSAKGNYLFKTGATLPEGLSDGPWNNEGIVCYVPHAAPHGTKPVYQLGKTDDLGVRFAFTSDVTEANGGGGWTNQGVAFHIANTKLVGTVPLYRLYKPLVPEKKKDKNLFQKFADAIAGEEFTTANADVLQDTNFYTIRDDEKAVAINAGFVSQGIVGYVWESSTTASGPSLPDLIVQKTEADNTSVTVVLRNQGKANTGGTKYEVSLFVYDHKGNFLFKLHQPAPGLSPNQSAQVKFDTGGTSLMAKLYQIKVDEANAVTESDEDNNETAKLDGPPLRLKPPTHDDSGIIRLTLELKGQHERMQQVGQSQYKYVDYDLAVISASAFPKDAFQPLTILPPAPCGARPSNARLFARIGWGREGKDTRPILLGTCIPLTSPQTLAAMTFSFAEAKGTANLLQIIVWDRLTGLEHESNIFKLDAVGVDSALFPLGCKRLMNRPDDFVCSNKTGMAACENLQKQGKPIKCRITTAKTP